MISAIYDLRCAPITYDFCNFLAISDIYASRRGDSYFDLIVRADAFRNLTPREKSYSLADRLWRAKNLISEVASVTRSVRNYVFLKESNIPWKVRSLIPSYDLDVRTGIPYLLAHVHKAVQATGRNPRIFRPSEVALDTVRRAFPTKDFVTLSLRSANFDTGRNANLADWWAAIERARIDVDRLIVVPDQDDLLNACEVLKYPWHVYQPAAFSLDLRLALMSISRCNLLSMGGMTAPLWYSDISFNIFNIFHENHYVANEEYFSKSANMSIGDQFLWSLPNQKLDWSQPDPDRLISTYFSDYI